MSQQTPTTIQDHACQQYFCIILPCHDVFFLFTGLHHIKNICNMMCHSDPLTVTCFSLVPGAGCLRWLARTSAKLQFARQMIEPRCFHLNSKMYVEYFHGLWHAFQVAGGHAFDAFSLGVPHLRGKCHESHKWKILSNNCHKWSMLEYHVNIWYQKCPELYTHIWYTTDISPLAPFETVAPAWTKLWRFSFFTSFWAKRRQRDDATREPEKLSDFLCFGRLP